MAERLLALVGPGTGPRLCTKRMGELLIRLSEFNQGVVVVYHEGGQEEREKGCEFSIPSTPWLKVEYKGKDRSFMATVHTMPNALSTS